MVFWDKAEGPLVVWINGGVAKELGRERQTVGLLWLGKEGKVIVGLGTLVGKLKCWPGGTLAGLVKAGWFGPG